MKNMTSLPKRHGLMHHSADTHHLLYLEEAVVHLFLADGGGVAVSWKDFEQVVKREKLGVYAVHERIVVTPGEVCSANTATEKGIAGDDHTLVVKNKGQTARTVARDMTAFERTDMVAMFNETTIKIIQWLCPEIHDRPIQFGLSEEFLAIGMKRYRQVIMIAHITKATDMIDMGMREHDGLGVKLILVDKSIQLLVLVKLFATRIDNIAILRGCIPNNKTIHLEVIEHKLLDFHKPKVSKCE